MMSIGSQQRTTDGVIGTSGKPVRVYMFIVHSGASAGDVVVYNGTSASGTEYDLLSGSANVSVRISYPGGLLFPAGCYLNIDDSNTAYVTAIYEQEIG